MKNLKKCLSSTEKKSKSEILSAWRELEFLNGLKEGGIVEWRCAKSFDLMADYLMLHLEENGDKKVIRSWGAVVFPMIRRCLAKNSNRITKVIKPEEVFEFLNEKTIGDAIEFCYTLKLSYLTEKKVFMYLIKCFERYLKEMNYLDRPLIDILVIFDDEGRKRIDYIFNGDYEAEVCALVSDYFCKIKKDKMMGNAA